MSHSVKSISYTLISWLFFVVMLAFAARYKQYNGDEATALGELLDYSFLQIIQGNFGQEANHSPLYYLITKAWLGAWSNSPQLHWELLLFFRVPGILAWASACAFAFYIFLKRSREFWPNRSLVFALLLSGASACILCLQPILFHYALEDRPYVLWNSLAVVQFLLFGGWYQKNWSKKEELVFSIITILMTLTAAFSWFQWLAILLVRALIPSKVNQLNWRREGQIFIIGSAVALFYAMKSNSQGVASFSVFDFEWIKNINYIFTQIYLLSTNFLLLDSYPEDTRAQGWGLIALIMIVLLAWQNIARTRVQPFLFYGWLMLLSSVLIVFACAKMQAVLEPRYFLYLVPTVISWYLLSLWSIAERLKRFFSWLARGGQTEIFFLVLVLAHFSSLSFAVYREYIGLVYREAKPGYFFMEPRTCSIRLTDERLPIKKEVNIQRVREACL